MGKAKTLKAIPTTYKGIQFRSKLEAKYARAFDKLGIVWIYEGGGFLFDDGTAYCPDFYMPDMDTYFEVKGVLDDKSIHKIRSLVDDGERIFVGDPNGRIHSGNSIGGRSHDGRIAKCSYCGNVFFLDELSSWECTCCGKWDGDHHLEYIEENIFDMVW